jgi:predicted RNase H-like HicB family nuclease
MQHALTALIHQRDYADIARRAENDKRVLSQLIALTLSEDDVLGWRAVDFWMNMHRFLIVIEKANGNFSAYSPDLPGCVATGKTREQATRNMYRAIEMHIRGLAEDKLPVPKSRAFAEYVAMPA